MWKKIKDFPKYAVSDSGEVKNIASGITISQRTTSNGYLRVNLRRGNIKYEKPKSLTVHRLVAEAFLDNPNNFSQVNHIDGNKKNNAASNLEWCTASENIIHAYKANLMPSERSTAKAIRCIETGEIYSTARGAEKATGIYNGSINKACIGKAKSAGGFHWEYA